MLDIVVDTKYPNFDAIVYYRFEYLFTDINTTINKLLKELDTSELVGGIQVMNTASVQYEFIVYNIIRCLLRLPVWDYKNYNYYLDMLIAKHQENLEFDNNYVPPRKEVKRKKTSTSNKSKVKNIYIRSEITNMFTGETEYDYTNFKTGHSFISKDPDLLEELNNPKPKVKNKKTIDLTNLTIKFKL